MSLIPDTPDIFIDEAPLDSDYQKEFFVERGGPVTELANHVAPVLKGRSPGTIVLHGGSGTGKSTTTQHIFNELQRETPENKLTTIHVEVSEGDTAYQALVEIVNEIHLLQDKDELPETGHSNRAVRKKLYEALSELSGVLLMALDDAHLLAEPNELLNDLSRARERSGVNVKTGIILIGNDVSFLDDLSSDTKSTLNPKEIAFPSYNSDELYEIIQQRASTAFHDDAVPESVLRVCAARSAMEGGDARYALTLLKEAGEQACLRLLDSEGPDEDETGITEEDLRQADEALDGHWFANAVEGLSTREKKVLYVVTSMACSDDTPGRTRDIHRLYEQYSSVSISERHLRDTLSNLTTQALLIRYNRNQGAKRNGKGGQYYEFELGEELVTVLSSLKGLDDDPETESSVEPLCEAAMDNNLLTSSELNRIVES